MLPFTLDTVRVSLHILAVTVWIGGQILVAALVPVLREVGHDAPKKVAQPPPAASQPPSAPQKAPEAKPVDRSPPKPTKETKATSAPKPGGNAGGLDDLFGGGPSEGRARIGKRTRVSSKSEDQD